MSSSVSFRKVKSVAKDMTTRHNGLEKIILNTMATVADVVGSTLGPGGCPVLIERQEVGMPNLITKDGVTVFRNLGFTNATAHAIMETMRDASIRTATEAGDGTTTATVLSEALVRHMAAYLKGNPRSSPQKVCRFVETVFRQDIEPFLRDLAKEFPVDANTQAAVVKCSTNGDVELSETILKCFEITGDEGNVTIHEKSGPSGYKIEPLKGYSLNMGFEESCRRFNPAFINDRVTNRCYLENPTFILYFGTITDIQPLFSLLKSIEERTVTDPTFKTNFVLMATGFGEALIADLAANFESTRFKIFPLLIPKQIVHNGEQHILQDLQAITSSKIFDPISAPIERGTVEDLGKPIDYFESMRYRSNIVGYTDEDLLLARIEEVRRSLVAPESQYEEGVMKERLAKLSGGIAKLTVFGASAGEIREKRDRAEDAVCALRGALKHGVLPGGGWGLMKIVDFVYQLGEKYPDETKVLEEVIIQALEEPLARLMSNAGLNEEEIAVRGKAIYEYAKSGQPIVWDGITDTFVNAIDAGVVDALPAVLEAVRNSISIATTLGTMKAAVVFQRDTEVERTEASDAMHFLANSVEKGL